MKTKSITLIAAAALLPLSGFTQTPPAPPTPPIPPMPPASPQDRHERMPKVPVTFLGVDTSSVPPVVCEQLGMTKGFGLVVDYVAPDGPAAAAGVQQNDILKMLNDQILLEPGQFSKLIRSYAEGTTITLTVLRKGKEEKVSVKLGKKEMPQRREFGPRHGRSSDFPFGDMDFGELGEQLGNLKDQFGDSNQGMIHDAVMKAHEQAQRVREEAQQSREEAQRIREVAQRTREEALRISERAREEARRGTGQIQFTRTTSDAGLKTTKIDIGKAQIVFHDDKGELLMETQMGKKMLTAKDPQGRLLFSGPIETKQDIDKAPADVRQRFENLQHNDLPAVVSSEDEDDDDADAADEDNGDGEDAPLVEQVSAHMFGTYRTVLI